MININEYIENSKKNKVNSLDITNHIENVIKDFDVKKTVDKVFKEQNLIYDKTFDLITKIDNQNEKIHKLTEAGTLTLNDINEYEKLIRETDKLVKDNKFESFFEYSLDNHKENLYNIKQERQQDSINNIENFLQYLNKDDFNSYAISLDRVNQVRDSFEYLSSDNKEIYTNKVINGIREFNEKIFNKVEQENKKELEDNYEQEVNYDFER